MYIQPLGVQALEIIARVQTKAEPLSDEQQKTLVGARIAVQQSANRYSLLAAGFTSVALSLCANIYFPQLFHSTVDRSKWWHWAYLAGSTAAAGGAFAAHRISQRNEGIALLIRERLCAEQDESKKIRQCQIEAAYQLQFAGYPLPKSAPSLPIAESV